MSDRLKESRRTGSTIKPGLLVGKSRVTAGIIAELDRILERDEVVKVKFLRSSGLEDKERMIARLSKETSSKLLEARGNTVTLFRARAKPSGKIYKSKSGGTG
jgi:RNA-binding protein YhbY